MKKIKRILTLVMMTALLLSVDISVYGAEITETDKVQTTSDQAQTVNIKIVHTNDTHGRAYEGQDNPRQGTASAIAGFDKVKAVANSLDAAYGGKKADFILDAGDIFHGLSFATMDKGESIARIVGAVGYDAISPGNHDWNYGQEQLIALVNTVKDSNPDFKMLAGNIQKNGAFFGADQTIIKSIDGVKVGVFGVSDPRIRSRVAPYHVEGLDFQAEEAYANQTAAKLRENGCEVVIAVSHGLELDSFAAQTTGIDAIIAGHEHLVFNNVPQNADGKIVRVVETGYFFNNIGVLALQFDKQTKEIKVEETLISPADASQIPLDEEASKVADLMTTIQAEQEIIKSKEVGTTSTALAWGWPEVRIAEQPIGRLITDSYISISGADIAFENAGGIRGGLTQGSITKGSIIDISPFGNYLETRTMKGSDIKAVLEQSLETGRLSKAAYDIDPNGNAYPNNSGSYLQCGGIYATYDMKKEVGKRVLKIERTTLDGSRSAFDENAMYTVVLSNYLAASTDYPEFGNAVKLAEYATCEESIIQYVGQGDATIQNSVNRVRLEASTENPNPPNEMVTVQYIAGKGGSITGNVKQTITRGTDAAAVTAAADSGYQFTKWSDGVKTAMRTDKAIDKDVTLTAEFHKVTESGKTEGKNDPNNITKPVVKPAVKTTDSSTFTLWVVLFVLSCGVTLCVLPRKKERDVRK